MRLYFRPPRSPVGFATGTIGTLVIGSVWLVLVLGYAFFVWPFQFIWQGLPRNFPNSKGLVAWQAGLTCVYVGAVVFLVVVGNNTRTNSTNSFGSSMQETTPPATITATTQVGTPSTPVGRATQDEQKYVGSDGTVHCTRDSKTFIMCHDHDPTDGTWRTYYTVRTNGSIVSHGDYIPGDSPKP